MNILVAEDELFQRVALATTLRGHGFKVLEANNGSVAWDILKAATEPLIAVLDWQMPDLSGIELCGRIRSELAEKPIYAIVLTGRSERGDLIAGFRAGADDYVTKPFDREELMARVQCGVRVLTLQDKLTARVNELSAALDKIRQLEGLLPICCYCKRVRADSDYWQQVEGYLIERTNLAFSHGICPDCFETAVKPELDAMTAAPV